jgi:benzoyl-CoA reductase/2-hydroxyglutaryl-CoA dehydratase subunit BcrC/BadD/HgdB
MTIKFIILWILILSIVYFSIRLMFEQRRHNNKMRELIDLTKKNREMKSNLAELTKYVPKSITAYYDPYEKIYWHMNGTVEEITDLLSSLLKNDKNFRDMVKSAFRKSGKSLG